jgi:hypothetical protein
MPRRPLINDSADGWRKRYRETGVMEYVEINGHRVYKYPYASLMSWYHYWQAADGRTRTKQGIDHPVGGIFASFGE